MILDSFAAEMNKKFFVCSPREVVDERTMGVSTTVARVSGPFPCMVYSRSVAGAYLPGMVWKDDVERVLLAEPGVDISTDSYVEVDPVVLDGDAPDGTLWAADTPDDIGGQGEALMVGLRRLA